MNRKILSLSLGLSGTALAAALVLPVLAQESLLPEGFGPPPAETPSPAPAPSPTPRPATPGGTGTTGESGNSSSTPSSGASQAGSTARPSRPATRPQSGASGSSTEETDADEDGRVEPGELKYDLPPGARRSLDRIGPLTPATGGMAPDAFGTRGQYAATLMRETKGPLASRWAQILLRRALASSIDTPETINGADLAAERAALLLRLGESTAARRIVQSVDFDRASQKLVSVAQQTYLANADPAGLCPYVRAGMDHGDQQTWRLASGMCSGMSGEAGPAGWSISRVRSSRKVDNFDILLAERVLGATGEARRATTIEWTDVDRLTPWRFGLATATAIEIPAELRAKAPFYMRGWTVLAPMADMAERVAAAPEAAARGVLSNEAFVSLLSAAASEAEPDAELVARTEALRRAFRAPSGADRYVAMAALWDGGANAIERYAAMVGTARAAAGLPPSTEVNDDPWQLMGSMMAGGFDRNAAAWASRVDRGTRAWGVLAVGLPQGQAMDAGDVSAFAGNDDSAGELRSQFFLAGLAGLGRMEQSEIASAAEDLNVPLGKQSRWTRAIVEAARRREPGMVALLAATGMQGEWADMPPYHLYHIVRSLRAVGLEAEARMIAAEALVRV
ncbi:hypothetical protein [Sphingopyxis sp. MWB1]|uniref:hypothetical protein n=1 Tax=Sphingopyxis sp. MWB1 TaxID=1537715 RepID=UPI00068DBE2A|nr:hypothetical protein [Sphingopyxis sp. MWB1]